MVSVLSSMFAGLRGEGKGINNLGCSNTRPAAYADADACIKISPKNAKGYLR